MIILFSSSLGLTAVSIKRKQIEYVESLIYLGNRVMLLLKSTMPETEEIINILKSDSLLYNLDFDKLTSPYLCDSDNQKASAYINEIGKYDVDSQIALTEEFTEYFKLLKKRYQEYFDSHYKLYIALGILSGMAISVLLI